MTETVSPATTGTGNLPESWEISSVGELYRMIGGGTPTTKKPEYWEGHISWISSADIHGLKEVVPRRSVSEAGIENSATNLVPRGSLLVVTRVGLGKVAIAPQDLCFSQDSQALIGTGHVFPDYALYYLSEAVQAFKHQGRGTTISGVTKKQLAELPFILPPLNEQRRIVEKIEELFTRLDAGVESLKKTRALLKKYRQSVLKAAVTGELSREWREEHAEDLEPASELLERILTERREKWSGKKYKEPASPETSDLPELPDKWEWATLDQLLKVLRNGISKKPSAESGLPILRISAVRPMSVDLEDVRFLPDSPEVFSDYMLEQGDLLFTRYNGNPHLVGVCGVVGLVKGNITHPDKLIRGEVVSHASHPKFLEAAVNVGNSRTFLARRIRTTAGQSGVSGSDIKAMPVPLPPAEEQNYIVGEVERRLSVVDNLEATIEENLRRSESLQQSVLKRAFSGGLVPQDPEDEPAGVLLERIREARLTTNQKSKKRRSKKGETSEQGSLFLGSRD